jgi:hypothetical protein
MMRCRAGEGGAMYRFRQVLRVSNIDAWNEAVGLVEEINKICETKGWMKGQLFTRTVGPFNELCVETEYQDLATFERENKEWLAEPGIGALIRRIDELATENPGYSELWEEATPVPS